MLCGVLKAENQNLDRFNAKNDYRFSIPNHIAIEPDQISNRDHDSDNQIKIED